jgi:hypothetical protein
MGESTYVKIACPSCSEHVEFPLEMRGIIVNCPHCTLSLVLDLPGTPSPTPPTPPPASLYQRLRALNHLEPKPIAINLTESFTQPPRSRP